MISRIIVNGRYTVSRILLLLCERETAIPIARKLATNATSRPSRKRQNDRSRPSLSCQVFKRALPRQLKKSSARRAPRGTAADVRLLCAAPPQRAPFHLHAP